MRVDEADENERGQKTFGVIVDKAYVVVTVTKPPETMEDTSQLSTLVLSGSATDSELKQCAELVHARLLLERKGE